MASKRVAHETGCPWWSRDRLATALGEERTLAELGERWNVAPATLREWIDRHDLGGFESLPSLGRDIASVLEQFMAEDRLLTTAEDIRRAGEIPEDANKVGKHLHAAAFAVDGLRLRKCDVSGEYLWRLQVDE